MKSTTLSLSATVLSVILLCSFANAQKIRYSSAPGTDFSKYKTYKWQRADDARYPDEENDKMLMRSIDAELASKGLRKVETEQADVYVIYQLAILDGVEWGSFTTQRGLAAAAGPQNVATVRGATTNSSEFIKSGSFILEIYDVAQKKQVWQAYATKTVDPKAELKKRERNTQKVMAKIMKNYPPPGK